MSEVKIGDTVRAYCYSGVYLGEIIEDRGDRYLVEVHAVQKHARQGDLDHHGKVDEPGVLFLERKVIEYTEKMNVNKMVVYPFDGEITSYSTTLKEAVENLKENLLAKDTAYNKKALDKLYGLEEHFYTGKIY